MGRHGRSGNKNNKKVKGTKHGRPSTNDERPKSSKDRVDDDTVDKKENKREKRLKQFNDTYEMVNFSVKKENEQYPLFNGNGVFISLLSSTAITKIVDESVPLIRFKFLKINEIKDLDVNSKCDCVAVIAKNWGTQIVGDGKIKLECSITDESKQLYNVDIVGKDCIRSSMNIDVEHILPEELVRRLRQAKCTNTYSILTTSDEKFRKFDFSPLEVQLIRNAVSKCVIPLRQPLTNAECIDKDFGKWKRITSGCRAVDRILDNGISNVGITEICGQAGSGKSQLCLQLAVTVQLPEYLGGFGRGAVYISTEESVPTSRTIDIAQHFKQLYRSDVHHINFSDNIFIKEALTEAELLECVTRDLPILMNHNRIGLIIIDSIGAVFRITCNYIRRAEQMRDLCQSLLKLSEKYRCAVVCVNQVSSVMNNTTSTAPEDQIVPCLGLVWANLVSTRLQMCRTNKSIIEDRQVTSQQIRKIRILFSPDLKQDSAEFLITSNGISDIS